MPCELVSWFGSLVHSNHNRDTRTIRNYRDVDISVYDLGISDTPTCAWRGSLSLLPFDLLTELTLDYLSNLLVTLNSEDVVSTLCQTFHCEV